MILRFVESFFRHWVLYLLPIVLLAGVGAWTVARSEPTYRSMGTMNVEGETLLSTLTEVRGDNFGYETPSGATSNKINSLLQTEKFFGQVAANAGLDDDVAADPSLAYELRTSVIAMAVSPNLLNVVANHPDPVIAQRLADATINSFVQWVLDADLGESNAAAEFFTDLLPVYQADLDQARAALDNYLLAHPAPASGQFRSDEEIAEINRLNAEIDQVQTRYTHAVTKREEARLTIEQTRQDISQRLQVVDSPQQPVAPLPRLKTSVFTMGIFVTLGLVFSLIAVVVGTLLDHTVRSPSDVKDRLGARLLATVPDAGPAKLVRPNARKGQNTVPLRAAPELTATRAG